MREKGGFGDVVFNNRDPVYLQVVRHFKVKIATGELTAGQVIPSRRELGAMLNINPNTAQRAYKEMEEQRLIVTEGNTASRITTETDVLRSIRTELIEEAVETFIASIRHLDVPLRELTDVVERKYFALREKEEES